MMTYLRKLLSEMHPLANPITSRDVTKFSREGPRIEDNAAGLPDAVQEVATWPDSKLRNIGYKIGRGHWTQKLIVHFEKAVVAELKARGLPMPHAALLSACCICAAQGKTGKAIYRVKMHAFCFAHKDYARLELRLINAQIDKLSDAYEQALKHGDALEQRRQGLKQAKDPRHSLLGGINRTRRKS